MEVKELYLDLKEGPQYAHKNNKNVRVLESEAFKEPLKIKIVYDNTDIKNFNEKISELKSEITKKDKQIDNLCTSIEKLNSAIKNLSEKLEEKEKIIDSIQNEIKQSNIQRLNTNEKLNINKDHLDKLNGNFSSLRKIVEDFTKSTKKPLCFESTEFIAGGGVYYYKTKQVPVGDYIVIESSKILEKNEYVLNRDSTFYFKVHVDEKGYTPSFQLETENSIDKPCATVQLTFLFFPM